MSDSRTSGVDAYSIIVLGDKKTGISSLIKRYVEGKYEGKLQNVPNNVSIFEGRGNNLHILDFNTFRSPQPQRLFRNANAVVIAYSVDNLESFRNVEKWLDFYKQYSTNPSTVFYLVANKSDTPSEGRVVPKADGQALAKELNMEFVETSAKFNHEVDHLFNAMRNKIIQEKAKPKSSTDTSQPVDHQKSQLQGNEEINKGSTITGFHLRDKAKTFMSSLFSPKSTPSNQATSSRIPHANSTDIEMANITAKMSEPNINPAKMSNLINLATILSVLLGKKDPAHPYRQALNMIKDDNALKHYDNIDELERVLRGYYDKIIDLVVKDDPQNKELKEKIKNVDFNQPANDPKITELFTACLNIIESEAQPTSEFRSPSV